MTAEGVAAVLAAHEWMAVAGFQQRAELACTCGAELVSKWSSQATTLNDHRAHVAEQVTAWLGEQLAAAEMREAVRDAIADCEGWQAGMWPWTAEANDALTAVAERLGITAEKGTP